MFAHGIEGDVAHENHFLVVLVERGFEMLRRILGEAREHLFVHLRHALGSFDQALAAGILAHAFEDQPHALFDFRSIHNRLSAVIQREASYHERSFRCGTRHRDSR